VCRLCLRTTANSVRKAIRAGGAIATPLALRANDKERIYVWVSNSRAGKFLISVYVAREEDCVAFFFGVQASYATALGEYAPKSEKMVEVAGGAGYGIPGWIWGIPSKV